MDAIRDTSTGELYPRRVLDGCESALVLFAAAWHGKQDAVWIADAGLTATCVDLDETKLGEMAPAYPDSWVYASQDCFDYAWDCRSESRRFDIVSIDCPSNLFEKCADWIDQWCLLANRAVVLGCGVDTAIVPPPAWELTEMLFRSTFRGGTYWAVVEPVA